MKSLIFLTFLVPTIGMSATCFESTSPVPSSIPQEFCLEKLVETNTQDELLVINGNAKTPAVLKIKNLSRHNEDRVNFTASAIMNNIWESGCGDGLMTTLFVKGEIAYGEINVKALNLSVEVETTNDTCHSRTQIETYTYKLKSTGLNYKCIADTLQAINSSIYYNLSSTEIDTMLQIPEMMGHIDAVNASKRCQ